MIKEKVKLKPVLYFGIRLSILLLTVFFILQVIDFKEVFIIYKEGFALWLLVVVILIAVLRIFLNAVRWKILNINNTSIKLGEYFKYMMISHVYNLFLPGVLGGDFARAVVVSTDNKTNRISNVMSIFYDRIVGMISLVLLAVFALIYSELISIQQKTTLMTSFISLFVVVFLFMHQIAKKNAEYTTKINKWKNNSFLKYIKKIANDFVIFIAFIYKNPLIFIKAFFLSLIIHVLWFYASYLIFKNFNVNISFFDVSLVTAIVWGITVLPISIAGIGVREITYVGLLTNYGVAKEISTTVAIYVFSISIIIAFISLPLLLHKKKA